MRHLNRVLLFCVCAAVAQASVIVPNALAGVEGAGANTFPFDSITAQRYQQVYAASQFSAGGLITQVAFRPDGPLGHAFSVTIANVQIDLSTTLAAPDGLSSTFASNVGLDDRVVFSGPLSLSSSFAGPAGGPKAFDIIVNLTTPFVYNPGSGNLLLDVRSFSGEPSGMAGEFDSQFTLGDPISRAYGDIASPTASVMDSEGLVTEFTIIPEPGTLVLLAIGILLVLVGVTHRRQA
ncbi:MAG TPA: PEP-CTERM sorting domain-containing protein [Bryobacteraceae bacterium]|nr:PEP-CTERM sorting domain-containing protein [Bryobacteraceae bacterium]